MIEDWRYSDENLEKRALCLMCCVQAEEEINTGIYEFCHYFTSNGLFNDVLPTEDNPLEEELKEFNNDPIAMATAKVKAELIRWRAIQQSLNEKQE